MVEISKFDFADSILVKTLYSGCLSHNRSSNFNGRIMLLIELSYLRIVVQDFFSLKSHIVDCLYEFLARKISLYQFGHHLLVEYQVR